MNYRITKDFAFSASHRLAGLPDDHQCARLHGHNYLVRVELSSPILDEVGMVFDYGQLAPFGRWLDDHYDHRDLNEATGGTDNPTAEWLAFVLAQVLQGACKIPDHVAVAVGVSETPKTWAWFRP